MSRTPLAVDLDDALLRTNTLFESLAAVLGRRPWVLGCATLSFLTKGVAAAKSVLAEQNLLDIETLPLREDFVAWLKTEAAGGRELHLVSAADQRIVSAVAERIGIFRTATGSDGVHNLKGAAKRTFLEKRFPDGFAYAGDSRADLKVWPAAQAIVFAGTTPSIERQAAALGKPVEARFPKQSRGLQPLLKAMRLHQWTKNLLVFLPLLLAHRFEDAKAWLAMLMAYIAFGAAASATYILNDMIDLSSDRRHRTKRNRSLAAATLKIDHAAAIGTAMLIGAFAIAALINWQSVAVLTAYLALTLSYSLAFKRAPLLDTTVLGVLFTVRLVMGTAAAGLSYSPWLLTFSTVLFFSLSTAKRQTEIVKKSTEGSDGIAGRGYTVSDANLTLAYGIASSSAALVILMLYITNDVAGELYARPYWLWAIPFFIHIWQTRIWFLAHRGLLEDDPIVFAVTDRASLFLGLCCAIAFYLAL